MDGLRQSISCCNRDFKIFDIFIKITKRMICSIIQNVCAVTACAVCKCSCVCVCVCTGTCVSFPLTRTPVTSIYIPVWGQTAVSSAPYIRLAIKTCLGPTLPHTLGANERCTISCTMKPLTTSSGVAWVIKREGGGGVEDN